MLAFSYAGLNVIETDLLGPRFVGMKPQQIPAHPAVRWLALWLPITPYVEIDVPEFRDGDPLLDRRNGVLYCSPAQVAELRRLLPLT